MLSTPQWLSRRRSFVCGSLRASLRWLSGVPETGGVAFSEAGEFVDRDGRWKGDLIDVGRYCGSWTVDGAVGRAVEGQRDAERVARMAQRLSLAGLRLAREGGAGVEGQGTAEGAAPRLATHALHPQLLLEETLLAIRGPRPDEGAATWVVSRCEGPLRRLASASPLAASTLVEGMTSILMRRAEGAGDHVVGEDDALALPRAAALFAEAHAAAQGRLTDADGPGWRAALRLLRAALHLLRAHRALEWAGGEGAGLSLATLEAVRGAMVGLATGRSVPLDALPVDDMALFWRRVAGGLRYALLFDKGRPSRPWLGHGDLSRVLGILGEHLSLAGGDPRRVVHGTDAARLVDCLGRTAYLPSTAEAQVVATLFDVVAGWLSESGHQLHRSSPPSEAAQRQARFRRQRTGTSAVTPKDQHMVDGLLGGMLAYAAQARPDPHSPEMRRFLSALASVAHLLGPALLSEALYHLRDWLGRGALADKGHGPQEAHDALGRLLEAMDPGKEFCASRALIACANLGYTLPTAFLAACEPAIVSGLQSLDLRMARISAAAFFAHGYVPGEAFRASLLSKAQASMASGAWADDTERAFAPAETLRALVSWGHDVGEAEACRLAEGLLREAEGAAEGVGGGVSKTPQEAWARWRDISLPLVMCMEAALVAGWEGLLRRATVAALGAVSRSRNPQMDWHRALQGALPGRPGEAGDPGATAGGGGAPVVGWHAYACMVLAASVLRLERSAHRAALTPATLHEGLRLAVLSGLSASLARLSWALAADARFSARLEGLRRALTAAGTGTVAPHLCLVMQGPAGQPLVLGWCPLAVTACGRTVGVLPALSRGALACTAEGRTVAVGIDRLLAVAAECMGQQVVHVCPWGQDPEVAGEEAVRAVVRALGEGRDEEGSGEGESYGGVS